MYAEIRSYNASHITKVRAITPYRWTGNDDGSGRDFAIGTRGASTCVRNTPTGLPDCTSSVSSSPSVRRQCTMRS